jgi:hypothetical protein
MRYDYKWGLFCFIGLLGTECDYTLQFRTCACARTSVHSHAGLVITAAVFQLSWFVGWLHIFPAYHVLIWIV